MNTLYDAKNEIMEILNGLKENYPTLSCFQVNADEITSYPTITFYIGGNNAMLEIDGNIGMQVISPIIDIWALTSAQGGLLLASLESSMRAKGYTLETSLDVPNPDSISHITTKFNMIH